MSTPKVSLVIPVCNAGLYLKDLLTSIASQSFHDFEAVFIDDGSVDESPAMLDQFCAEEDRFQVLHIPNGGKYLARSIGIDLSKGRYVAFADSDDVLCDSFLEKLIQTAERTGADLTVCGFVREEADTGRIHSREMIHFEPREYEFPEAYNILPMVNSALWNKLFKRELLQNAITFEQPSSLAEDMMFCLSLYPHIQRIAFVPEPLYRYRVHSGSAMSYVNAEEMELIRENMKKTRDSVRKINDSREMRDLLDSTAFIHFGLSLLMRQVQNGVPVKEAEKEARDYLEKEFPGYRRAGKTLAWNLAHQNAQLKILLGRRIFCAHLMRPFLSVYDFLSRTLGREIKW